MFGVHVCFRVCSSFSQDETGRSFCRNCNAGQVWLPLQPSLPSSAGSVCGFLCPAFACVRAVLCVGQGQVHVLPGLDGGARARHGDLPALRQQRAAERRAHLVRLQRGNLPGRSVCQSTCIVHPFVLLRGRSMRAVSLPLFSVDLCLNGSMASRFRQGPGQGRGRWLHRIREPHRRPGQPAQARLPALPPGSQVVRQQISHLAFTFAILGFPSRSSPSFAHCFVCSDTPNVKWSQLEAMHGFWRSDNESMEFFRCISPEHCEGRFQPSFWLGACVCAHLAALGCVSLGGINSECAANRVGALCAVHHLLLSLCLSSRVLIVLPVAGALVCVCSCARRVTSRRRA